MPFSGRCGPLLLTRIVFFSHSCYTERDSLCGREENILIERLCRWSVPAFLLLEGALYLFFLALDLLSPGPLSTALKYAALLLCLLMALAGASRGGDRLVAAALAMTAAADLFLLVPPGHPPLLRGPGCVYGPHL